MMYTNNNNNNFAFIAKAITTDVAAIDNLVLDPSALVDGDLVIVDDRNFVRDHNTALTGTDKFKFANKIGGEIFYSPLLNFANCTITAGKSTAAAQQVTNIGGTTAGTGGYLLPNVASDDTIAATEVGNSFYVLIEKQDNDEANRMGYAPSITAQVKMSSASGSDTFTFTTAEELQVNLGAQLREAIAKNDALEVDRPTIAGPKYVRAKVVANVATQANITGGANNATLTFGSKTVTTDAACEAGIAAADYLNVAGDLYKIASDPGTGTTITLEDAYRGPTATLVTGTGAAQVGFSTAAQVNAATCIGVELVGTEQHSYDVVRDRIHSESRFNVRFAKDGENVGASIVRTTAADEGLGSYEQVAYEEYHSLGQLGLRWVSDIPGQVRPANADSTKNYGCVTVREVTTQNNSFFGSTHGKISVNVWFELESDGTLEETTNKLQKTLQIQLGIGNANLIDRA